MDDATSILTTQEYAQIDDTVFPGRAAPGPMTLRMFASLMEESVSIPSSANPSDNEGQGTTEEEKKERVKWRNMSDMKELEMRLKNELATLGLLDEMVEFLQ